MSLLIIISPLVILAVLCVIHLAAVLASVSIVVLLGLAVANVQLLYVAFFCSFVFWFFDWLEPYVSD
jgi:hypothetical protein